ncbi:Inner membrane protein YtfF [Parachlamydia sp. AcF125]|nr:Inner membrane protein YtfF [Parachlamydia sp. AcF125]
MFALTACFVWGLIFIIPQTMVEFSSFEVVLGRYLVYGLLSLGIFLSQNKFRQSYPLSIWLRALGFSFVSTVFYYTCLVLALRYSNPTVCTLILSISPITISLYGSWVEHTRNFRGLFFPSLLILFGLVVINFPYFNKVQSFSHYGFGILGSFLSNFAWSWYVVANAKFLKSTPQMASTTWSTLVGVSTLFWAVIWGIGLIVFGNDFEWEKYTVLNSALYRFLNGCLILGGVCSWFGAYLWNKASLYLPVTLAGQLTIFETIFGLLFVYIFEQRFPPLEEFLGIGILLSAVFYGIQATNTLSPQHIR